MTRKERREVIAECARICELTAETVLEDTWQFDLTLYERITGRFKLWGQNSRGGIKKEQLLAVAKILNGMQ
jgi:hypothetical protein